MNLGPDRKVRVSAQDDVMVTGVTVTVLDAAGQSLEQGEAQLVMGVWWDYQAANRGRIQVEARDLAGNVVQQEFDDPWKLTPLPKNTG
jgi:hypothetical protein